MRTTAHVRTRPLYDYRPGRKTRYLMTTDPYAVLGVPPSATQAEITHAYRRHLRDQHPDTRDRQQNSLADEKLRQILAAYDLLRDPQRRAAYDHTHPARKDTGPVRIAVTRTDPANAQPPLRAGPVRWRRTPPKRRR
ncbi:J domain-containing protein [Mycobacterium lacus]|uniref:J domain-containing protein n=1 Tax=Mycobacterium lacus TaxID=169765 RepID=UPI003555FA98